MKDENYPLGLVAKAKDDFGVPIATEAGCSSVLRKCGGLPLMSWPDYSACFEANCWIDQLRSNGLVSVTSVQYGYLITWVLRYAHEKSVPLYEFNEYHFVSFMKQLKEENLELSVRSRSPRQNGIIGRKTLDFLEFVGTLHDITDLVAPQGRIQASKKIVQIRTPLGKRSVEIWFHSEVPIVDNTVSSKNKLLSKNQVESIKKAIRTSQSAEYFRNRQRMVFVVLEETGARREEAALISVKTVMEAKKMLPTSLLLSTSKKGGLSERLVEISPALLTLLEDYIKFDLTPFLESRNMKVTGSTPLFVSAKTLKSIQPNTITAEFLKFKKATGIEGSVSPHMLRHNSVTQDRIDYFREHPNEKAIARIIGLNGVPEFALRSMEKHGHSSLHSQVPYDHFEKLIDLNASIDGLGSRSTSALRSILETIRDLTNKEGANKKDVMRLKKLWDETLAILEPSDDR